MADVGKRLSPLVPPRSRRLMRDFFFCLCYPCPFLLSRHAHLWFIFITSATLDDRDLFSYGRQPTYTNIRRTIINYYIVMREVLWWRKKMHKSNSEEHTWRKWRPGKFVSESNSGSIWFQEHEHVLRKSNFSNRDRSSSIGHGECFVK